MTEQKKPSFLSRLKNSVFSTARTFDHDEQGAVAIWFGILLIPMLGFTFGAIKYTELAEQRTSMIDAMDAAALGLARQIDFRRLDACEVFRGEREEDKKAKAELDRYAREMFIKNYPGYGRLYRDENLANRFSASDPNQLVIDTTCSAITMRANVYSDMGGILGKYFGVGSVLLPLESEITLAGAGRIELAYVLDVSGSMDQHGKYEGLKTAVKDMMDDLYGASDEAENEFVKTAVVPFNSIVNIGADIANKNPTWMDRNAQAMFHGANFIDVRRDEAQDTDARRLVVAQQKVNHFDLFNSMSSFSWDGCVESRPFPLDELPVAPGSALGIGRNPSYTKAVAMPSEFEINRDAATTTKSRIQAAWNEIPTMPDGWATKVSSTTSTPFVPWFYPDEPDCKGMSNSGDCRPAQMSGSLPWWIKKYSREDDGSAADVYTYIVDDPQGRDEGDGGGSADWSKYYYEGHYWMRSLVRDSYYLDFNIGKRENVEPYWHYILEYRNAFELATTEDCSTGKGRRYFYFEKDTNDPLYGDDYDEFVAAAKAQGVRKCDDDEYRVRQAYPGVWNPVTKRYEGKYDLYQSGNRDASYVDPNFMCGPAILPMTTRKKDVLDHLEAITPEGSTNSSTGMAWGWRMLTHEAPFTAAVDPATIEGAKWSKYAILMSDGKNNISERHNHNLSGRMAYGYGREDRLNIVDTDLDDRDVSIFTRRSDAKTAYDREMDNKTIRICNRMQAEGIKVFVVGYGLNYVDNEADRNALEAMLKGCANSAEEEGDRVDNCDTSLRYYRAENATELKKAFGCITDAIVELHVSG